MEESTYCVKKIFLMLQTLLSADKIPPNSIPLRLCYANYYSAHLYVIIFVSVHFSYYLCMVYIVLFFKKKLMTYTVFYFI